VALALGGVVNSVPSSSPCGCRPTSGSTMTSWLAATPATSLASTGTVRCQCHLDRAQLVVRAAEPTKPTPFRPFNRIAVLRQMLHRPVEVQQRAVRLQPVAYGGHLIDPHQVAVHQPEEPAACQIVLRGL
jgi:hypothetical protein